MVMIDLILTVEFLKTRYKVSKNSFRLSQKYHCDKTNDKDCHAKAVAANKARDGLLKLYTHAFTVGEAVNDE